jgi:glycosyltransferase involved in cell wall biosynthesis
MASSVFPNMPKISLLVWNLSTNDGAIRASLLSAALQQLGYQVEICGFLWGDEVYKAMPTDLNVHGVNVKQQGNAFKSVKALLDKIEGDIIYAIKPQLGSFGVALLKRMMTRRPVIVDIDDWELSWHGGDDWHYRPHPKQLLRDVLKQNGALRRPDHPLYLHWMEQLVPQANAITVHTHFLQQRFGGISVPNGKDIHLFDPQKYDAAASRSKYGLSEYRVLMFPGAPRPYKGLEDVLAALEQLQQPDLRLVIVGGSPYDDYDQQLLQQWGQWLIKLPRQSAEKMPEIVAAAHVVVLPQRDSAATRAQFPLKITDGMAMAKPVIASRVGDIPEILGGTGYLVDPSSPEQLAAQIQWVFDHFDQAIAQGQKARDRCIKHYSIDSMASILSTLIAGLK